MGLSWSRRAEANLTAIVTYVAKENPSAAKKLVSLIVDSAEQTLSAQPLAGRPGRIAGTREWIPHKHYVVVYMVRNEDVTVLAVRHTSPAWPKKL